MIYIFFLIFISLVVLLTYLDLKLWGTIYTPTVVLAWPFLILLIIDFLYLNSNFVYFNLNQNLILIWLFGVLSFWSGGVLIKLFFKDIRVNKMQLEKFNKEVYFTKSKLRILLYILYPLIFIVILKVYLLLDRYDFNLADEEFQGKLGAGFIAHCILLLTIISVFLIIFFNKNYYKLHQVFVIIITLIFSVLYGVKSWIIIPLVSSFIGRILLKKTKFKVKHLIILIVPFFVFWLIYKISLGFGFSNEFIFQEYGC